MQKAEATGLSDRVFGFAWCGILAFLALFPLWRGAAPHVPLALAALLLAVIAIAAPRVLAVPNRLWTRFGKVMHGVTSSVVLFLLYYFFFTPGAALLRLCGRSTISRGFDRTMSTYWTEREPAETDFTRPF